MRICSLIAVVFFLTALAAPARAGMAEDCVQDDDQDLSIGGCTAVIRSGEYSGTNLAKAYSNRGAAYSQLGEHRRAIEDYDQALRLYPGNAAAYKNRGVAHEFLGAYDRAASDWEQAIRIDGASRARPWQVYLKSKGRYSGAIDGIFGPILQRGLLACAIDPNC